jgi:hypothetical protein
VWSSISSRHFEGTYCLHLQSKRVNKLSRRYTSLHRRLGHFSCLLLYCLHLRHWKLRQDVSYVGELVPNFKAITSENTVLLVQIYLQATKLKSQDTRRYKNWTTNRNDCTQTCCICQRKIYVVSENRTSFSCEEQNLKTEGRGLLFIRVNVVKVGLLHSRAAETSECLRFISLP